ncbi:MAG: GTP cyclohydrolase I FolE [Sulfuricurvum sp.]|nr:GTP cyclohydrolase I FolE [Sulfuricurvum sp.]
MDIPVGHDILIADDIVDTGLTISPFVQNDIVCIHVKSYTPNKPKYYVREVDKLDWIDYWWEKNSNASTIEDNVTRILQFIGEDPTREGLQETPKRVAKSLEFMFSGYKQDPTNLIKVFDSNNYDEIVLLKDIEVYSHCEHHILPFFGKAHVAYIPDGKVLGVSKLARIVDMYSKRLQIQERLCQQVTECLETYLHPKGAACIIEASHLCMRMRGVQKQHSSMITSSLTGAFLDNMTSRQELMGLIK